MTPRSPRLLRVLMVLVGVGAALLLVALAEVTARLVDPLSPQEQTDRDAFDYQAWTLGPCYRESFGRLQPVRPSREFVSSAAQTFSVAKPPGVRRIVVVGESTGEMLERELASLTAQCAGKVEVLRCSASGSRPFITVRRVQEALAWSPDVIVVAIGHNFMLPGPPTQKQLAINRSRLVHEAQRLLPPRPVEQPAPRSGPPTLDDLPPPDMGREAYRQILAMTKPKGVEVLALVLSSNLRLRPNATLAEEASPDRARARVQWARGDLPGAIKTLEAGADTPLRAFDRGVLHEAAGEWTAAKADFERARDTEPNPTRASTAVTQAITEAAREGGASIMDVASLFEPLADHGIPGWETYFDNCHPHPAPLRMLATAVLNAAAPSFASCVAEAAPVVEMGDVYSALVDGPTRLQLPNENTSIESARRRIDGPISRLLAEHKDEAAAMLERYDREVLTRVPPPTRATTLNAIGALAFERGRYDIARWCADQSVAAVPNADGLLARVLLNEHDHRDAEAEADLARAKTLSPEHPLVRALMAQP